MDITDMYTQLHWFCEVCDKLAVDKIFKSNDSNFVSSIHKEVVKDIVAQVGSAIKEANECIKTEIQTTVAEILQGSLSSDQGNDANMDEENIPNTNVSYCRTTSEVFTSFFKINEEKERSKKCFNVVIQDV